jgi:hypothetical protein
MPFVLIFFGLLFLIAGVRGTVRDFNGQPGLYTLLKTDFWGPGSYAFWVVPIVAIGAAGYVEPLKGPSRWMLALVVIVLILAQQKKGAGGFFAMFTQALNTGITQAPTAAPTASAASPTPTAPAVATGPHTAGVPDLGITDLLNAGPQGQAYLQQLEKAWQQAPAY